MPRRLYRTWSGRAPGNVKFGAEFKDLFFPDIYLDGRAAVC